MPKRSSKPKRPRDTNQLAKLVAGIATGEAELPKTDDGKDPAAVAGCGDDGQSGPDG